MNAQRDFAINFLNKEAECWTKYELGDSENFNSSVRQLYSMAIEDMDEAFGIFEEEDLDFEENPINYIPGYLFKLSEYRNSYFGTIWIAYTSYKNPIETPAKTPISRAFIISKIENELKILGMMSVALAQSNLKPIGWEKSIYNPSTLNIHDLGEFITTERYSEPKDDGFSLKDYLADK